MARVRASFSPLVIASDPPAKAWQAGAWQSPCLNSKLQNPKSKQIPISTIQMSNEIQMSKTKILNVLNIDIWCFDIVWDLVLRI
jgi:hypothetical protein